MFSRPNHPLGLRHTGNGSNEQSREVSLRGQVFQSLIRH